MSTSKYRAYRADVTIVFITLAKTDGSVRTCIAFLLKKTYTFYIICRTWTFALVVCSLQLVKLKWLDFKNNFIRFFFNTFLFEWRFRPKDWEGWEGSYLKISNNFKKAIFLNLNSRSSHRSYSVKYSWIFCKFIAKYMCQSFFLNKVLGLQLY